MCSKNVLDSVENPLHFHGGDVEAVLVETLGEPLREKLGRHDHDHDRDDGDHGDGNNGD